jgi:magnesium chelatase family protein
MWFGSQALGLLSHLQPTVYGTLDDADDAGNVLHAFPLMNSLHGLASPSFQFRGRTKGSTHIELEQPWTKNGSLTAQLSIGLLVATGQLLPEQLRDFASMGELALDGSVRPIKGALSMAMSAAKHNVKKLLVPAANAREAAVVEEIAVYGVSSLAEAVGILAGQIPAEPVASQIDELFAKLNTYDVDFADVRGQEFAKRALVVAASGAHNVLMIGSPGTGKTMLARRLPTILPSLTPPESLETTRIYSALGRLKADEPLLATRPFRDPHQRPTLGPHRFAH